MYPRPVALAGILLASLLAASIPAQDKILGSINVQPRHISTDASVKWDYPIVYVRAPRNGDNVGTNWTEISNPTFMDGGADLMLLHPDGRDEVLVTGGKGSVTDPMISFDGQWIYYALLHDLSDASFTQSSRAGADIYKLHVPTRKIIRLTDQTFTPNTGAGVWSKDYRTPETGKNSLGYGVFNMGPCPLPGGKVMFTSNRNAFRPPKRLPHTLQLFIMDDPTTVDSPPSPDQAQGRNIECVGHLNLGMALHPVVLTDGRVMFSSLESQGLRYSTLWGLWTIHPDGANWGPLLSAFLPGNFPSAFHFQTQLSDGSIVAEEYYNQTSSGFGGYVKFPPQPADGNPPFGPGYTGDPRNPPLRHGRFDDGRPRLRRLPFSPFGIEALTTFARTDEGAADFAVLGAKKTGARVGRVTHPSGAPDNHLLTIWSPGPVNGGYTVHRPAVNGGIYLIKDGKTVDEPGQMLLIKDDPNFNEQWPRALVSYERIYGIKEPKRLPALANDGKLSPHLPAGTPFGLVGTSSFYKRESYPNGLVAKGSVTAGFAGGPDPTGYQHLDPFNSTDELASLNWLNQGADAGRYTNDDIHAVRILAMEPTTDRHRGPNSRPTFRSHATERLRILGEIPLRHFVAKDGATARFHPSGQPLDPDGNPDTSFLAKIPADVGFTFQTLDKDGMVLNMAQTWHQVRPGEVRHDCGGCHAHSQQPTRFENTYAARPDYKLFDLTTQTPLLTSKGNDQSGRRWDVNDESGLRFEKTVHDVEFYRDVKPILDRSCIACHTQKSTQPPAKLVLDDDAIVKLPTADDVSGTYYRLAMDYAGRFGHQPLTGAWRMWNASRYVRMFQSRRSLLVWKVLGRRTDGWTNDDFPTETTPGNPKTLQWKGQPLPDTPANRNRADLDYDGKIMPPPEAVAGTYVGPDGNKIKVAPLSDEDKRTLIGWIDLGCPIDLDSHAARKDAVHGGGFGWFLDDQRPTLALTLPRAGANPPLDRILVGMHDYAGLDAKSFEVTASFSVNGIAPGQSLASKFQPLSPGVWELRLEQPLHLKNAVLNVSVKDRQGNVSRIERHFSSN